MSFFDIAATRIAKRLRIASRALVCLGLAGSIAAPGFAFADQPGEGPVSEVSVSEEGDAALREGFDFGLSGFSRAQKGSNREIDGAYRGYAYYVANEPGSLAVVATDSYVVAYIPESAAKQQLLDASDSKAQQAIKDLVLSLDKRFANGGSALSSDETWYFTSKKTFDVDGVRFCFDKEAKKGRYYACVIGADGSDVTEADNPHRVVLSHADFAQVRPASEISVSGSESAFDRLASFLSGIDYSPLWITLKTTLTAIVFIFVLGLAAAYFSLRIPARAQDVVDSLFTIPMVLPPTVCGFLLLLALGKNTAFGQWFIDMGCPLIFSWPATVIAAVVVAFPLMYRNARGAFEGLDANMLDAARTLGWSNAKIFFRLMIPLSWSSIAAGTVLSFARALGEFGATLFLAGNYLGITRTVPIAIYFEWMNGNTDVALFWTLIIMLFSFAVILLINVLGRRTTKYRKREVR